MEICLPWKFTKKANKALQMDVQMIIVNKFFGHWFTDIYIRRYPDDLRILPTDNSVDVYQYSNAQMKYLPEKSVEKLLKTALYSNKPLYLTKDVNRRSYNGNSDAKRADPNLTYRLVELKNYIFDVRCLQNSFESSYWFGFCGFFDENRHKNYHSIRKKYEQVIWV